MFVNFHKNKKVFGFRCWVLFIEILIAVAIPLQDCAAQLIPGEITKPPALLPLSANPYTPGLLMGLKPDLNNPLQLDFLIMKGEHPLVGGQQKKEYTKLIKYFLAALTIPEDQLWVNLSPYEKNRIIADDFGKTQMGIDLLAQDYLLKQITSSLIYPESDLGKEFWTRIYQQNPQLETSTDLFNRIWIVPDKAIVYEDGNTSLGGVQPAKSSVRRRL